ncbi:DUF3015 family protein [Candidatus Nitrospira bockiana]
MNIGTGLRSVLALLAITTVGCMTQPTLDATKAPFRASTRLSEAPTRASSELTNGTTDATRELTRPTTETTSPRSWFSQDGIVKPEYKLTAFAAFNVERLREDIARGEGEYVTSLAVLMDIPTHQKGSYASALQGRYQEIFAESRPGVHSLLQALSP